MGASESTIPPEEIKLNVSIGKRYVSGVIGVVYIWNGDCSTLISIASKANSRQLVQDACVLLLKKVYNEKIHKVQITYCKHGNDTDVSGVFRSLDTPLESLTRVFTENSTETLWEMGLRENDDVQIELILKKIPELVIYGSPTLKRYTVNILNQGFLDLGVKSVVNEQPVGQESSFHLIQIHGSPQARSFDLSLISQLPFIEGYKVLLLHRPDQINQEIPELNECLKDIKDIKIVTMGSLVQPTPFPGLEKILNTVPHGFFKQETHSPLENVIIIGSHSTWGEMRSVSLAKELINSVIEEGLRRNCKKTIVGYIGGAGIEFEKESIHLLKEENNWRDIFVSSKSTIYGSQGDWLTKGDFDVSFNLQLYHYGENIRMGESSGSLHASQGIPVVIECNNADRIENFEAIKIPYSSTSMSSLDIKAAAKTIVDVIENDEQREKMLMLLKSASVNFSPVKIGELYNELFLTF